jgi:hypothetical protein
MKQVMVESKLQRVETNTKSEKKFRLRPHRDAGRVCTGGVRQVCA